MEDYLMLRIHRCIHDRNLPVILIDGTVYDIVERNYCRSVKYDHFLFIEQNRRKNSVYARRARQGEKVTWIIPDSGSRWGLIINDNIERRVRV